MQLAVRRYQELGADAQALNPAPEQLLKMASMGEQVARDHLAVRPADLLIVLPCVGGFAWCIA